MYRRSRRGKLVILLLVLALAALPVLAAPTGGLGANPPTGIEVESGALKVSAELSGSGGVLTVRGPNGFKQQRSFSSGEAGSMALLDDGGGMLADGLYRFNFKPSVVDRDNGPQFGVFYVQNGQAVSRAAQRQTLAKQRTDLAGASAAGPMTRAPRANAGGPSSEAFIPDYVTIYDLYGDGVVGLYLTTAYGYFPNGFDFRSNGFAGFLGYPAVYVAPNPYAYMGINGFGNSFVGTYGYHTIFQPYFPYVPFQIRPGAPQYGLTVTSTGLGAGTASPAGDFHLTNLDGVGDTVFKLVSATGNWNIGVRDANGVFTFNKVGSPQEFSVREADHAVATLDVAGHVRGTSFKSTSSRALKTGFEALDPTEVLTKILQMPVTSWRYKTEDEGVRHFGPVAEDFERLFGLGDGKTIASIDADGVLMAAVQGLNARLEAKDAEIDALRARLQAIEEQLEGRVP